MAPTGTEPAVGADAFGPDPLGDPYAAATLRLRDAPDGEAVATLVRRRAAGPTDRAVLHVHGFADYFFQVAAADYWTERGYDFYALDLRRYGRSLRPHQAPGYVADLREYDEELDLAWAAVNEEHSHVVLSAHSTGGLTVPLWLERREHRPRAVVLNSPWLDMHGSAFTRQVAMRAIGPVGRRYPMREIRRNVNGLYARSLHRDHAGEWDFDLRLKPIESFRVYAGWLRAVRIGHLRLARGLRLTAPVLVLTSAASGHPTSLTDPVLRSTDVVLDVERIRRRAPLLGTHVTLAMVPGAMHDVTLSSAPVRAVVFEEVDRFLDAYADR